MALFTDGPASCMEDLTAQDSQLLDVASVEGIDVTQKLFLAQDELALELNALLSRLSNMDQLFWLAPQPNLGSVVVTPALKLWHTFRSRSPGSKPRGASRAASLPVGKKGRAAFRRPSRRREALCWSRRRALRQKPRRDGTSM